MRTLIPMLGVVALCGCASDQLSYVGPVDTNDAPVLANGVAEFVALQVRAPFSTIALDPTPADQAGNVITPAITYALNRHGFAVAANRGVAAGAHPLSYVVTPMDDGGLLRLTLDDAASGARFFARTPNGGLRPDGPFAVTEAVPHG